MKIVADLADGVKVWEHEDGAKYLSLDITLGREDLNYLRELIDKAEGKMS